MMLQMTKRIVRIGLGILFAFSGLLKILSPASAIALVNQLLAIGPQWSSVLIAMLCLLEIIIGLMLAAGKNVVLAATLSCVFLFAAVMIGSLLLANPVPCGCFGDLLEARTDEIFLLRNLFFLGVAVFVLKSSLSHESQNFLRRETNEPVDRVSA